MEEVGSRDGPDAAPGEDIMRRRTPDDDLDREIRAHLDVEAEERMADGLSPEEARSAARRAFGNVTRIKETIHDLRRFVWLDHLGQDLRYGVRQLRRSPGFALAAIITLALGVSANTTAFTLLNALALRPMPVPDAERIQAV